MQRHRIISGLTILLMFAVVAAGYFLVVSPQMASASTTSATLSSVQSQIRTSEVLLATYKSQQKKLPELRTQLAELRASIPSNVDGAGFIRELSAMAESSGVVIQGAGIQTAMNYTPPAKVSAPTTSAGSSGRTPSPTPSASAPTVTTAPSVAASDPLITTTNFVAVPVTVTTEGGWGATMTFLKGIQSGQRLFLVTKMSTSLKGDDSGLVDATFTGYLYVLTDPTAATSNATASKAAPKPAPTASATPESSQTGTPTPTPTATR